ncbi:MAG: hypothetical protein IJ400_02075 [Clostridia bacterium]|nr:hypothetical protein [Clostridia bacterium]
MHDNETNDKKTKKRFNIFDWYYKGGKESDKKEINALKKPSIKNFFILLWRKLTKLLSANLIFVFGNFPLFFLLLAVSGFLDKFSPAPMYLAWGPLEGAITTDSALNSGDLNPVFSTLAGVFGIHGEMRTFSIPTYILFALGLLIIFTWGFTKVGTTYLYRNLMSGEAVFPLSDFFYIIKKNIKQSLIVGIIDSLMTIAFIYNIFYLFNNFNASTLNAFMLFMTVIMFIVFSFIKPYVYIMIFMFDLKISQIIKNALYFTILGIKRNMVALVGSILLILLNYGLFLLFMPLGAILPFIITISVLDFMWVYAAYPNILKHMMDEADAKAIIEHRFNYEEDDTFEDDAIKENEKKK